MYSYRLWIYKAERHKAFQIVPMRFIPTEGNAKTAFDATVSVNKTYLVAIYE